MGIMIPARTGRLESNMYSMITSFKILFAVFIAVMTVIMLIKKLRKSISNHSGIQECIELLRSSLGTPKEEYRPDQQLYDRYLDDITNAGNLNAMAYDILSHCSKQPWNITVYTAEDLGKHTAGQYIHNGTDAKIRIRIGNNAYDNIILSVLIHECMHHFLITSGIGFEETDKNEVLTDTAALYLGFSKYMNRGYIGVGYLSYRELLYAEKEIQNCGE